MAISRKHDPGKEKRTLGRIMNEPIHPFVFVPLLRRGGRDSRREIKASDSNSDAIIRQRVRTNCIFFSDGETEGVAVPIPLARS